MRICVVTRVFNDWRCADLLIHEIAEYLPESTLCNILIVDDGSTDFNIHDIYSPKDLSVSVLRLATNVGHQRAIAIGLVEAVTDYDPDFVVVIDADGEDDPGHIGTLLATCQENPDVVVVAQRRKRFAPKRFIWLYAAYKSLFRASTGEQLNFGNFAVMSRGTARRLISMTELWNHFPATVMKSKVSIKRVPLDRRARLAGESQMNFVGLINHGLAGLAVFSDKVFARLLLAVTFLTTVLGLTIVAGIAFRLSTSVPIPGWVALTLLFAAIGLLQLFTALLIVGFMTLSSRNSYSPAPVAFTDNLIAARVSLRCEGTGFQTVIDSPS